MLVLITIHQHNLCVILANQKLHKTLKYITLNKIVNYGSFLINYYHFQYTEKNADVGNYYFLLELNK